MPAPTYRSSLPVVLALAVSSCKATDPAQAAQDRENALLARASEVYDVDWSGYQALMLQLESAERRDLLRMRLAMEKPERGERLCTEMETAGGRSKCEQVLSRPHLYRSKGGSP